MYSNLPILCKLWTHNTGADGPCSTEILLNFLDDKWTGRNGNCAWFFTHCTINEISSLFLWNAHLNGSSVSQGEPEVRERLLPLMWLVPSVMEQINEHFKDVKSVSLSPSMDSSATSLKHQTGASCNALSRALHRNQMKKSQQFSSFRHETAKHLSNPTGNVT